jgi:hypothetical protein
MIIALLAAQSFANPIQHNQLPQTFDYSFEYPAVGVQGVTSFTYEAATRFSNTDLCADLPGCMTGTFYTGNGGVGVFITDLERINCDPAPPPTNPNNGVNFVETTCDVNQTVSLVYNDIGAVYEGEAVCGQVTGEVIYTCVAGTVNICLGPQGFVDRTYTLNPENFSGTITATNSSGTFAGAWMEL